MYSPRFRCELVSRTTCSSVDSITLTSNWKMSVIAYSPTATSIKVMGGPLLEEGRGAEGKLNVFSGASSGHRVSYDVSRGAKVLVRDVWYKSGAGPGFAKIHDRAMFTADGVRISSAVNQLPPAFDIVNLSGAVAILTADIDDRITLSGDGKNTKFLGAGIFCQHLFADCFFNNAPSARAVIFNARQTTAMVGTRSVGAANVRGGGIRRLSGRC